MNHQTIKRYSVTPDVNHVVHNQERLFDNLNEQIEKPVKLAVCAEFLGKSQETVRRYCRLNYKGFPSFIIGKAYHVRLSSVSKWLSDLERNFRWE
jgi:heterodisulfide reductase subunit B